MMILGVCILEVVGEVFGTCDGSKFCSIGKVRVGPTGSAWDNVLFGFMLLVLKTM